MIRSSICTLLIAVASPAHAGTDGYLRQGPPQALRFAPALIPPPSVNELILALGRPVEVKPEPASHEAATELARNELPDHLKPMINDLIAKPAGASFRTVVDTAAPVPSSGVIVGGTELPETEPAAETPTVSSEQLTEILGIFNTNQHGRNRQKTAVVTAPAVFLPPQPATPGPSSRAVYGSP